MRTIIIIFQCIVAISYTFAQTNESNQLLRDELLNEIENPVDSIYIEDRNLLTRIDSAICSGHDLTLSYKSESLKQLEIILSIQKFDTNAHQVDVIDEVWVVNNGKKELKSINSKNLIDSKYAYGIDGNVPKKEIKEIDIKWNGVKVSVPRLAYSHLFEPNFCWNGSPSSAAYLSKDNKFLYLYISGSDGAGSYSSKLVFDNKKFITSFTTTIEYLNGFDYLDGIAKEE